MISCVITLGNFIHCLIETMLDYRQFKKLKRSKFGDVSSVVLDNEKDFNNMKSYNILKIFLSVMQTFYSFAFVVLIFKFKVLFTLYSYSESLVMNQYFVQILFFIFYLFMFTFIGMPFDLISTFLLEERYGFNKMTFKTYVFDFIKNTVLTLVLTPPIVGLFLFIIERFPKSFYLQLFVSIMLLNLLMTVAFPVLIQPLFNKFESLKEGELKDKIAKLADSVKFKASKILVMDGSKRSGHSNAYFIGLFREKRIVLYDTLLDHTSNDEIVAILCHEFGHWFYSHSWKGFLYNATSIFSYLYLFNYFLVNDYMKDLPTILSLIYFMMAMVFFNPLETLLKNAITRNFERQADAYAVEKGMGEELKSGLIKLNKENMSNICLDEWYSIYHHSHPSLFERMELIDQLTRKNE